MSIIQAAGSGEVSTGFYKLLLDQSLKFDDGKSSGLKRTPASAGNQRLWTFSAWAKKSTLDVDGYLFGVGSSSTPEFIKISNSSTDQFEYAYWNGSVYVYQVRATALLRDTSAWYHIVLAVDTAQGTAANRVKFYVNGTQLTDFSISTYPTQNADTRTNAAVQHRIGSVNGGGYYDGYIAEVNFIDGSALTPDSFGETNKGIWVPKDTSGLTFGTNGFHLTFKDDVVSEGFNAVTWRGTGASNSVSGIGFSPAFVWIKDRTDTTVHYLHDVCRGAGKEWYSNGGYTEYSDAQTLKSFDGDGFTVGTSTGVNGSADDVVAWCWEGGGAPTADNSAGAGATPTANSVKIDGSNLGSALAGSIAATRLTADTTKGFSAVTYTGTGSAATVAHGLGAAPKWIIVKRLNATDKALVYHTSYGSSAYLYLGDSGSGETGVSYPWNGTDPTTSVFSVNSAASVSSAPYIAYCWAEVSGYSKFGSFTGNGGSQAIDVGFEPAFVMLRRTNGSTWGMFDNLRGNSGSDRNLQMLAANSTAVETTNSSMTFSGNTFNDNGYLSDNGTTVLYMAFADTREAAFFKDVSSNGNHLVPVNLDYRDSVPDTPTNNFATFNAVAIDSTVGVTLSEGNLGVKPDSSGGFEPAVATYALPKTGKWYWEYRTGAGGSSIYGRPSIITVDEFYTQSGNVGEITGGSAASNPNGVLFTANDGGKRTNNSDSSFGSAVSAGDIIGNAYNADTGQWYIYINNSIQASGAAISESIKANLAGKDVFIMHERYNGNGVDMYNFGQDSSFSGLVATSNANSDGEGHGSFAYAPPSGYLALCSQNLPNAAIIDGSEYFNTVLYTGNAADRDITGVGFSPDWVWVKNRSNAYHHGLFDSVRGANKVLKSSDTSAEATFTEQLTSFNADGFSLGDNSDSGNYVNISGHTYASWNWLAGTAFSNDASATGVGTIDSSGQVNTTAGFSIVSYTATGTAGTIAHGLSAAPEFIIVKHRDQSGTSWPVYYGDNTDALYLSGTDATTDDANAWNDTSPTSTVFSVGANGGDTNNTNGGSTIAYCFHSVSGYSKVGSYVGNGNADGPFVYTGFRPAWILFKNSSTTTNWEIYDTTRQPSNVALGPLYANLNSAEESHATLPALDILSNGFKPRSTWAEFNTSGQTYIYLAFAESPFKFANAR